MSDKYRKLYSKTITLPVIPYKGINSSSPDKTKYYALLEKNYTPVISTESTYSIPDWCTISINTSVDTYYNRLIITSVKENKDKTERYFTAEFKANVTDSSMISQCNSIYAKIILAPYENISVHVEFIALPDQLYNGNNLNINGNEQTIKVLYYGENNGIKVLNKPVLICNLLNDTDIISKTFTNNGVVVEYKINENIISLKQFIFTCEYSTKYNKATLSVTCTLSVNNYELILGIDNLFTKLIIISNGTNKHILKYKCYLNGNLITSGFSLQFFTDNNAVLLYKAGNRYTTLESGVTINNTQLNIESNITDSVRKIYAKVIYGNKESNIVTIELEKSNIEIIHEGGDYQLGDTYNIDGKNNILTIKYYALAHNKSKTYLIISESNIIDGNTVTNDLSYENITDGLTILSDNTTNGSSPYKTIVINVPENTDSNKNTLHYNVTFVIGNVRKTITINQAPLDVSINVISGGPTGYSTTETLHGLILFNTVTICTKIKDNKGNSLLNPDNISIIFTLNVYAINLNTKRFIVIDDYIIIQFSLAENYGMNLGNSRLSRFIKYKVKYIHTETSELTIEQYPVFFGANIYTSYTNIISAYALQITIYAEGIIYNSHKDLDNKITTSVERLFIQPNNNNYVTLNNVFNNYSNTTGVLTFTKNISGNKRKVIVKIEYKNIGNLPGLTDSKYIKNLELEIIQDTITLDCELTEKTYNDTSIIIDPFIDNKFDFTGTIYDDLHSIINIKGDGGIDITDYGTTGSKIENGVYKRDLTLNKTFAYEQKVYTVQYLLTLESGTGLQSNKMYIIKPIIYTLNYDDTVSTEKQTVFIFENGIDNAEIDHKETVITVKCRTVYLIHEPRYKKVIDSNVKNFSFKSSTSKISDIKEENEWFTFKFTMPANESVNSRSETIIILYKSEDNTRSVELRFFISQKGSTAELFIGFNEQLTLKEITKDLFAFTLNIYCQFKLNGNIVEPETGKVLTQVVVTNNNIPTLLFINNEPEKYNNTLYKYTVNSADMLNSITTETYTITVTWNRKSESITIYRKGINSGEAGTHISLIFDKSSVPAMGTDEERTVNITYCLYSFDKIVDIGDDKLSLNLMLNGNSVDLLNKKYNKGTVTGTYKFDKNLTETVYKLVGYVKCADYNILTSNHECIQGSSEIDVKLESSTTTLNSGGLEFTLTYYGMLNGSVVLIEDEPNISEGEGFISVKQGSKTVSDNKTTITYIAVENISDASRSVTFNISYMSKTTSVTLNLGVATVSAKLTADKNEIGIGGDTVTFTYYGIKNNVNDTNNVTIECDLDDVVFTDINVGTNNITAKVIFGINDTSNDRTYKFKCKYEYTLGKFVYSDEISLTQKVGNFEIYIEATPVLLNSTDSGEITVTAWLNNSGSYMSDVTIEKLQYDGKPEIVGLTFVNGSETTTSDGKKQVKYSYLSNTGENGNIEKWITFKATSLFTSDKSATVNIRLLGGSLVLLPPFDYLIFDYRLINDISTGYPNFSNKADVTVLNKYAGSDLDTRTEFRANDSKYINIQIDTSTGEKIDTSLNNITLGFGCTIDKREPDSIYGDMLRFSGDNLGSSGLESVYINLKKILNNDLISQGIHTLYINLYGHWFVCRGTGKVNVVYKTYDHLNDESPDNYLSLNNYIFSTTDTAKTTTEYDNVVVYENNSVTYTLMAVLEYNIQNKFGLLTVKNEISNIEKFYGTIVFNKTGIIKQPLSTYRINITSSDLIDNKLKINLTPAIYQPIDRDNKIIHPFKNLTENLRFIKKDGINGTVTVENNTIIISGFTTFDTTNDEEKIGYVTVSGISDLPEYGDFTFNLIGGTLT